MTTAQEDRKPSPGLSSSFYHQDSVSSDGRRTSKSVQTETEHRKERSEETNTIEPTAFSEAQKTFKQDDGYRPPVMINPSTYDGSSSWLDYKSHFEACASLGH